MSISQSNDTRKQSDIEPLLEAQVQYEKRGAPPLNTKRSRYGEITINDL